MGIIDSEENHGNRSMTSFLFYRSCCIIILNIYNYEIEYVDTYINIIFIINFFIL